MDRLPALIALALVLAACEDRGDKPGAPPPSRVEGGKTAVRQAATAEEFCDVHPAADKAATLQWPALAPGSTTPPPAKTWRWINVWATWCKPCIEEIPRLQKWRTKLAASHPFDLALLSVDEADADVAGFRKDHPETPPSVRIADSKAQEAWFAQLGLTGSPPIPIHIFVDPQNRIRCVRAGGVRDQDFAVVDQLLQ